MLACFYIPDFAAWALAQRWCDGNPAAELAVCARGRVLSCTPALRRTVTPGDPVDRARRLAPNAQFLLRDVAVEQALWDHLLFQLYELTPQVQAIADPLASAGRRPPRRHATADGDLFGTHDDTTATKPCPGLWDNGAWTWLEGPDRAGLEGLARELGARVGVAGGRSWALLAAAYADPGSLTTVPDHMVAAFLRQAPVELLSTLRFAADLIERLQLFGMRAVGHATHLTRRQLQAQFGTEGVRLFELLHPPAVEPPVATFDPRVLRAGYDFEWPVFEPAQLQPVLHHLLAQLATRLDGRSARHLEVRLHGRDPHDRSANRILKEPTRRLDVLRTAADNLLLTALTAAALTTVAAQRAPTGRSVHRLSVTLSGLTHLPGRQAQLFTRRTDLLPALVRVMDTRFPGKLLRPVRTHADPFFPEEEYRFEPVAR